MLLLGNVNITQILAMAKKLIIWLLALDTHQYTGGNTKKAISSSLTQIQPKEEQWINFQKSKLSKAKLPI